MAQPNREGGDQRRLWGGLGDNSVACCESRGGRADEDRQREIPRADRGEDAAPGHRQPVLFARRARQHDRLGELAPRLERVIAQEIDRFAQFEHRVGQGLTRLALAQREEFVSVLLEQIRRLFQQERTALAPESVPARLDLERAGDRILDLVRQRIAPRADFVVQIVRLVDRGDLALFVAHESGLGVPVLLFERFQTLQERFAHQRIGEVDPGAVHAVGEDILRQRDVGIAARRHRRQLSDRIGGEILGRDIDVRHTIDEAGIGPVFEQAPHQIGEQVLMAADRRIDPHRGARIALFLSQGAVNILAHPVQALKLEFGRILPARRCAPFTLGQRFDRTDRIGVVRGEGGIDQIARRQQPFGTGEIGHVGRDLAREDREILVSAHLAQFDFGIPIRALHQPHEQLAPMAPCQLGGPVAQRNAALLIGLDGEAETGPAARLAVREQAVIGHQRFKHVEREVEAFGFFRIDGEMHVGIARPARQSVYDRHERSHGGIAMHEVVFGIERGQLDRDARRCGQPRCSFAREAIDRLFVGYAIAFGIVEGHRRFAQHVETVREAARALGLGALQRFVDGAAKHELAAEDAHRLKRGLADHRFAEAIDSRLQSAAHALLAFQRTLQHFARQHKREGGGVDEGAAAFAEMFAPVDIADLVADQRIGGLRIGHA